MRRLAVVAGVLGLAACGGGGGGSSPAPVTPANVLTRVSQATPFAANCDGVAPTGTVYPNAEVEPSLAVNPLDSMNLFGTWQQDRWSDGGAHGLAGAVSFDGGQTWSPRLTSFSRCSGGTLADGGDFERATDPWVSFSPNGNAYWMALTLSDASAAANNAMRVSRSTDGGDTWETPTSLIVDDSAHFNDKNSLTADPVDADFVYAVWDRLDSTNNTGPSYFSRSVDGGVSWETARAIYDPGVDAQTIGNEIVVLPDGTLVDLFTEIQYSTNLASLKVIRSGDQGLTWSAPAPIADLLAIGARDPETGQFIRDGAIIAEIDVGPTGTLYVAWQDSRFSAGQRDGIALSSSTDGGLTWSAPVQVNGAPGTQAYTPSVAVAPDGTIGVSYYDLRDNTASATTLPTDYWLASSADGLTWTERRISGPFDQKLAPVAGGLFLGDYQGLLGIGADWQLFFVQANTLTSNRTDVFTFQMPVAIAATLGKAAPLNYKAMAAPEVAMTREWRSQLAQRVLRERHRFPDRATPIQASRK